MTRSPFHALCAAVGLATAGPGWAAGAPPPSSCLACHGRLEPADHAVTLWSNDVHAAAGLGCESCHGGDPAAALSNDPAAAMAPRRGFTPAPDRLHVAEFCARCHADPAYMKHFAPQARVDQLAEYRTSTHGRRNAAGDPVPATCTDCHGAHGVRPIGAPDSPVFAANVPATCGRCHADEVKMRPYGLPTRQLADYRGSEHAAALLERGDLSAPACNDCHGNHGAIPPGLRSVAFVCGQCHGREAALFRASFKQGLFDTLEVSECVVCHSNHRVLHPSPELFHRGSAPTLSAGTVHQLEPFQAELGDLAPGQTVTAEWTVVLRPAVAASDARFEHRVEVRGEGAALLTLDATLRPGEAVPAQRLAQAAGLAASLSLASPAGSPVDAGDAVRLRLELRANPSSRLRAVTVADLPGDAVEPLAGAACMQCHSPGDPCDEATDRMYSTLLSLEQELRRASGRLAQAEQAGMEVARARFELKSKGTPAAVEARALVHSFEPERLVRRAEEGRAIAASALAAAEAALDEMQFRRKGLAVSLVLVGFVLLALFLKIRQIDRRRAVAEERT
ncbi:MAG TPA: cytochrome c3 family protein [Candidatus Polarisedimenticolaceae bacterium]|nr:cytochrome c3 family protein [Candidatus Polarisedimenticolaceae bacterium]